MKETGSNITITDSVVNKMDILPLGNTEQDTIAYIDVGTWEVGNINGTTGQEVTSADAIRTDFISVKSNVLYNLLRTITTGFMYFRFYNSNKQYLGTQLTEGMITTNQPDNRMSNGVSSMTMTINNTNVAYMRMVDSSNNLSTQYTISTQAPTPSYPQPIKVVTGDNQVIVSNSDNTQNQSTTLHLGSLELCKIGDYQDVITGSIDNWKVVRNVGKVVLNGSESWAFNSQLQNIKNFTTVINSLPSITNTDNVIRVVSNKLIGKSASVIINQASTYSIAIISNKRIFVTTDTTFTTSADDFKTWLQTNNITIYYQLAEPTEETITDTSLIEELNELQELLSYDGTTNITITSDSNNAQMEVEVTYTSESDMNDRLTYIFDRMKSKLYHIIRAL